MAKFDITRRQQRQALDRSSLPTSDRRHDPRQPGAYAVACKIVVEPGQAAECARLIDLSQTGVCIFFGRSLNVTDAVTVVLTHPSGIQLTIDAVVRRVGPFADGFEIGCQFIQPIRFEEMMELTL